MCDSIACVSACVCESIVCERIARPTMQTAPRCRQVPYPQSLPRKTHAAATRVPKRSTRASPVLRVSKCLDKLCENKLCVNISCVCVIQLCVCVSKWYVSTLCVCD